MKFIVTFFFFFMFFQISSYAQTPFRIGTSEENNSTLQSVTAYRIGAMGKQESISLKVKVSENYSGYSVTVARANYGYGWQNFNTSASETTSYTDGEYANYYSYTVMIASSFYYFNLPN